MPVLRRNSSAERAASISVPLETVPWNLETEFVHIREYRPEDFNDLWRLDQECFPAGIAYSRFELMSYMRGHGAFTVVAEENGSICGFAVGECRRGVRKHARQVSGKSGVGHVITIDVRSEIRRSGVGCMLMDALEERMGQSHCEVVYLEAAVDNEAAIRFYKRRGYEVLSTIPRYYDGKVDALVMGKKLVQITEKPPSGNEGQIL